MTPGKGRAVDPILLHDNQTDDQLVMIDTINNHHVLLRSTTGPWNFSFVNDSDFIWSRSDCSLSRAPVSELFKSTKSAENHKSLHDNIYTGFHENTTKVSRLIRLGSFHCCRGCEAPKKK